jgi:hypothetical protein
VLQVEVTPRAVAQLERAALWWSEHRPAAPNAIADDFKEAKNLLALMRTTLAIDDDVLVAAKRLAAREQRSIGEVISTLARQGLSRGSRSSKTERNDIPLLPGRKAAVPVTLELVNQLRDEQP